MESECPLSSLHWDPFSKSWLVVIFREVFKWRDKVREDEEKEEKRRRMKDSEEE